MARLSSQSSERQFKFKIKHEDGTRLARSSVMMWLTRSLTKVVIFSNILVRFVWAHPLDEADPKPFNIRSYNAAYNDIMSEIDSLQGRIVFAKNVESGEFGVFLSPTQKNDHLRGFLLIPTVAKGEAFSDWTYELEIYSTRDTVIEWIYERAPHIIIWHESAAANESLIESLLTPHENPPTLLHEFNLESKLSDAIASNKVSRSQSYLSVGRFSLFFTPMISTASIVAANWAGLASPLAEPKPHYALLSFVALRLWPRSASLLDRWADRLAAPLQRNFFYTAPENTHRRLGYATRLALHSTASIGCAYLIAQLIR